MHNINVGRAMFQIQGQPLQICPRREREKYQEGKSEGIYYRMISSDVREGLRKANIGREMTLQLQSLTKLVTDEDLMS